MMKKKMFVSYMYPTDDGFGFGNTDVEFTGGICGIEEVRKLEKAIAKDGKLKAVVIMNWNILNC